MTSWTGSCLGAWRHCACELQQGMCLRQGRSLVLFGSGDSVDCRLCGSLLHASATLWGILQIESLRMICKQCARIWCARVYWCQSIFLQEPFLAACIVAMT
jgi:hypothetical protein